MIVVKDFLCKKCRKCVCIGLTRRLDNIQNVRLARNVLHRTTRNVLQLVCIGLARHVSTKVRQGM